ncbi:MAG: DUF6326 family protein [Pseudomonadota bacterium]
MEPIDPRIKLSALWLFVLLNIIFRDLHQFAMKPFLEMLLTGTYHGTEITEELMLIGGVLAEVPIAMVPLSLVMTHGVGRFVTSFAALITAATLVSSAPMDLDDILHLIMELLAIAAIVWTVWRWPGAPTRPFR